MDFTNVILMIIVLVSAAAIVVYFLNKKKNQVVEENVEKDDKTFTLEMMTDFVKRRLDEITKINLYDIRTFGRRIKEKKKQKI